MTAAGIFARRVNDKNKGASISKLIIEWSLRSSSNQFILSTSLIVQNVPSSRPKYIFISSGSSGRPQRPEQVTTYLGPRRNHQSQQYSQHGLEGPSFVPIRQVSDTNLDQNRYCSWLFSRMLSPGGMVLFTG